MSEGCTATPVKGAAVDPTTSLFSPNTVAYPSPGNMATPQKKFTLSATAAEFSPQMAPALSPLCAYPAPARSSNYAAPFMHLSEDVFINSINPRIYIDIMEPTLVRINMFNGGVFNFFNTLYMFNINPENIKHIFGTRPYDYIIELVCTVEQIYDEYGQPVLWLHG